MVPAERGAMIPVSAPLLNGNEADYVADCISSGWISSEGKYLRAFEEKWANYCGVAHGVSVTSGTAALQVAMSALQLDPGSEVLLPSYTIISCAIAIIEAGCTPVLVDCDPATWCMNLDEVAAKITSRSRAIMPVHMFGHPVDMRRLKEIAAVHDLRIIEDAAQAHGAMVAGRRVGSMGDMACFSFYANKIVTTGEGGMVVTNDQNYAERLRALRNLCFRPDRRFYHTEIGHNYRMTNVQAAIGLAQMEQVEDHINRKRWIAKNYTDRLSDLAQLSLPTEQSWAQRVFWMYGVVLSDDVSFDATEFASRLRKKNIDTRPFFLGMHEQPVLQARGLFAGERYPVTERLARRGLYLPSGLPLTEAQIDEVCSAVRAVLQ